MMTRLIQIVSTLLLAALLVGCERFPMNTVQHGYRGTGMVQVYNPRTLETQDALNTAPAPLPAAATDGPRAKDVYKNVQVLGNLSAGEFVRVMTAMTNWVAPTEGCVYCHNPANFAEDTKYTKVVARRMVEMTRHINSDWKNHVAETGVTCYTCHRGNPVPAQVWFTAPPQDKGADFIGDLAGQNIAGKMVNLSSLPTDPLTPYLLEDKPIRVNGPTALPSGNRQSIKQAEWTYGLMTHMSNSLGVNCTYCHNSRSFQTWEGGPPQRVTAYYGIRMARDLNNDYMTPLTDTFPPERKGAGGDVAKVSCATCHQGAYKPLYGTSMLKEHPELAATP
ncbi:MAG: Photosynthetic reaction center cytochrome c subunit precursor [Pseudomonadota bacterium]